MKLYQKTTSERGKEVSKGGNDYIQSIITYGEDRKVLANIEVRRIEGNVVFYTVYCNDEKIAEAIEIPKEKGNNQKCKICDGDFKNPHKCR